MPVLFNKVTGRDEFVPNDQIDAAIQSGEFDAPADLRQVVTTPAGRVVEAPRADILAGRGLGAAPTPEAQVAAKERAAYIDQEHGGLAGGLAAGATSFVDSALLGLPGAAVRAVAPGFAETIREQQEAHPITSGVASVAGVVAPALLTGGSSAAAGIAAKTGAGAAARLGAGAGIQELTAAPEPITVERAVSAIGSNVLTGAGIGFGVGAGGKALGRAISRGKNALDEVAARARKATVTDDLAGLDRKGLREAREAHIEELATEQTTQKTAARAEAAAKLDAHRAAVKDASVWQVVDGEESALLAQSSRSLRNATNDPKGLAKNPGRILGPLRVEEQALERTIAKSDEVLEKLGAEDAKLAAAELATLPDNVSEVVLQGKVAQRYGQFVADAKVPRKNPTITIPRDKAAGFLEALRSGEVQTARRQAVAGLPDLLTRNRAFQAELEAAAAPALQKAELQSVRLTAIDDALDGLAGGGKKGFLETAATHYAGTAGAAIGYGIGGPIGSLVGMAAGGVARKGAGLLFKKMGASTAEVAERTSRAVAAFLDAGAKAGPVATPLATRVLTSVAFAPEPPPARGAPAAAPAAATKETPLLAAYRKREGELQHQVIGGQVSSAARAKIAERLAAVNAASPMLADAMETVQVRRLEFLASKLPRRPDIAAMRIGPDTWQPSELAMRAFARYVAAVEDPGAVEERLAAGTVTPEDAEAYRAVYPERFADIQRQIMEKLPELRETLPYERRLALCIFTGIPVDPAMHPRVLRTLQASYANEEGTEGGTAPPMATPQFGSVKSPEKATAAQERAAGGAG